MKLIACGIIVALFLTTIVSVPAESQQPNQSEIKRYSVEAQSALSQRRPEEAASALEQLARLTPNAPEVFATLGTVYYTQGKTAEAARNFRRALRLNPELSEAEFMLGLCDAELGLYQDATRILEPAFRRPHDPGMERLNGLELQKAYVELGDYGKASAVFDELLRRYPDDPEILFFSSRLYADRAEQSMERLALVAPESVWIARAKATVHEYQKEYDAATLEYRNAIRIDPTQPGLHFALGRVFLEKSSQSPSVSEALREFEQESELQPQNPDVEYEIGDCYRRLGDSGQALAHLSNAVQYNPNFAEAQIGLGRILIDLNRPKDALDHLLTAVHDDGNNEITHYLLFSDYRTLGNRVDAQRELETFRRLHKMRNAQEAPSQARGIVKQTLESGTMVEPE